MPGIVHHVTLRNPFFRHSFFLQNPCSMRPAAGLPLAIRRDSTGVEPILKGADIPFQTARIPQ